MRAAPTGSKRSREIGLFEIRRAPPHQKVSDRKYNSALDLIVSIVEKAMRREDSFNISIKYSNVSISLNTNIIVIRSKRISTIVCGNYNE